MIKINYTLTLKHSIQIYLLEYYERYNIYKLLAGPLLMCSGAYFLFRLQGGIVLLLSYASIGLGVMIMFNPFMKAFLSFRALGDEKISLSIDDKKFDLKSNHGGASFKTAEVYFIEKKKKFLKLFIEEVNAPLYIPLNSTDTTEIQKIKKLLEKNVEDD